jgi:fatty-acyl-CoA synthase
VLNALNYRLDAASIAFILEHGEAKVLITDTEFSGVIREALAQVTRRDLLVIDIVDPEHRGPARAAGRDRLRGVPGRRRSGLLVPPARRRVAGDRAQLHLRHHRQPQGRRLPPPRRYLNAVGNMLVWGMGAHPVYLWTLPMFHCNGWCFPWTIVLQAGTHVCLRRCGGGHLRAIAEEGVTHLCGAPIVMGMLLNAKPEERAPSRRR